MKLATNWVLEMYCIMLIDLIATHMGQDYLFKYLCLDSLPIDP